MVADRSESSKLYLEFCRNYLCKILCGTVSLDCAGQDRHYHGTFPPATYSSLFTPLPLTNPPLHSSESSLTCIIREG
jgi:hypothetical protein